MQKSQRQINFSKLMFGISLVLLVVIYGYGLISLADTEKDADWIVHTYQVKAQIEKVHSLVKDAERGQRGYLITQNPFYDRLYQDTVKHEQIELNTLGELIKDNPVQQQHFKQLKQLVQARLAFLQQVINAQGQQGQEVARKLILTGTGLRLMNDIQTQVNAMGQEEERLLTQRQKALTANRKTLHLVSFLAFMAAIAMLTGALLLSYSTIKRYQLLLLEKSKYADLLEQSNQDLGMVAMIASHDLKAPLRKISFFTGEILKDSANTLSQDSRDMFARIQLSSEKMQNLIESILSIATRQSTELPVKTLNLSKITKEVISLLDPLIQETQGRVEIGPMCSVSGDQYQIAQLMQNLIENALKYHLPNVPPVVSISAQETPDRSFEIRVKDNGIGMDREHQADALQLFKRLPEAKEYTGTGIGLGSIKLIVERHHGNIQVHSTPGNGAEFIVTLPR